MNTSSTKIIPVSLGLLASLLLALDTSARVFVPTNSTWRVWKGTSEASMPTNAWRELDFDDSAWAEGVAPFHFGTNAVGGDDTLTGGTILSDMRSNYTCLFLRQKFVLPDTNAASSLVLNAWIDDGLAIWISGQRARNPVSVTRLAYNNTATATREGFTRNALVLSNLVGLLSAGTNVLCLQAFNWSLTDEDFRIDVELAELPGVFALATNTYTVQEYTGQMVVRVVRTGVLNAGMSVDYATTDGSAVAGSDYEAVAGTLVFAAGQTEQTITVRIFNDALIEGTENFQIQLSNPGGGAILGSVSMATVQIIDRTPALQFTASTCSVTEGAGAVALAVQRLNDTNVAASVDYATADGTATNGLNYAAVSGTLVFGAGETNKAIVVPILNNGLVGGTKTFQVILSNPTNALLGTPTNATVSITDNDKGLHFYVPAISVNEDAGEVTIKVARGDDGNTPVSVDYATTNGTAVAGQDYTATAGTIVFAAGEVLKSFTVPILNDALAEPAKTFQVSLRNPTGGTVLSTPALVTVTVTNTDQVIQFDSANYYAREEAEFVQIGVVRGESDSAATVDVTTSDGTARAGLDYAGVTNTIQFAAGERLKRITLRILNDPLRESSESFQIRLSNPTGGDVLGSRAAAPVTIADNDPGVGFTRSVFSYWTNVAVANIGVLRGSDDVLSSFTVDYQTANGSAQAGVDYQAASGTLRFEANQTLRAITIPLLQNPAARGQKYFTVTLSNASGGIPLGSATTQVRIFHPAGYYPIVPWIAAKPRLWRENSVNLLSWEGNGVLQHGEQVTGPWEDLAGVASPYASRPSLPLGFYRLQSARPTEVYVPSGYDGQTPLPLILLLHPYGASSDPLALTRSMLPLEPLAESRRFLLCYPIGTLDAAGKWFWNGPDFLSFSGPDVDDSGYLRGVIEEIQRRFAVDPKRIYVTGYSSGGAMSHRLALEHADLIAGIASMAGRTYYDPNACRPTQPVNVLLINGSADTYLGWTGPDYGMPFVAEAPGAFRTVQIWAGFNGCQNPVADAAPSLDVTTQVPGTDTTVLRYTQYPPGGSVELWTVNGGTHGLFWNNNLTPQFLPLLVDWLLAHPKP